MELPLELVTTGGELDVETTPDHSTTRLLLTTTHRASRYVVSQELDVSQVRDLAGALTRWLVDSGHPLRETDLPDEDLEDEDEAQPATVEHQRPRTYGEGGHGPVTVPATFSTPEHQRPAPMRATD